MATVVIVIHLILAVTLVGVVLLQKSEGGALGMGGGGMSGFMSGRSTANLLTRTTAIVAAAFFATSIALAVLAAHQREARSIIDEGPVPTAPAQSAPAQQAPAQSPAQSAPAQPAQPAVPS
ncbi:MAG TPA: preprotein translocase subunit SecG, partial [Stellaceae bacterium]|nr:preprotein translocase subunit SecG [Stellaceae bacterium]